MLLDQDRIIVGRRMIESSTGAVWLDDSKLLAAIGEIAIELGVVTHRWEINYSLKLNRISRPRTSDTRFLQYRPAVVLVSEPRKLETIYFARGSGGQVL